jgi:hypothetical protein
MNKHEKEFIEKGFAALAEFNAEKYRGLVHTPEYTEKMKEVQKRFDEEHRT